MNLGSPIGAPATGAVGIDTYDRTEIGLDLPALFDFAGQRLTRTGSYMPSGSMPERTYSGYWNETNMWGWTSGFYAGQLWKMYRQTGDADFLNAAKSRTADLEGIETYGGDHDIGFRVFNSFGQGYKSLPDGDPDKANYLTRVLVAADTLAGRYRPAYQAIESWGGNQVIIDNMMNLELLFWASENTTDPVAAQQWYDIAVNHATTSQREHVRPDGSTYHVVQFDGTTGEVIDKRTAQGYADESTWSRGQAWGLYGFTMTYRFTDDTSFLNTAVQLAEYWLAHMPADGLVPYDFDDPNPDVPLDTSAAAIASCALLELTGYVDPTDAQRYFDAAETMLTGLSSLDALTNGLSYDSILMEGSRAKNEHHMGLIYGDYYFIEALQRYQEALGLSCDFNTDGAVDHLDLGVWQASLGIDAGADGDADGDSDLADLLAWQRQFGAEIPAAITSVPEPGTLLVTLAFAMAVFAHRMW